MLATNPVFIGKEFPVLLPPASKCWVLWACASVPGLIQCWSRGWAFVCAGQAGHHLTPPRPTFTLVSTLKWLTSNLDTGFLFASAFPPYRSCPSFLTLKMIVPVRFCQLDTKAKLIREQGTSGAELTSSDWPIGKCVWYFLDCSLVWGGVFQCGWCGPSTWSSWCETGS